MRRKLWRLLVWIALAACLYGDGQFAECLFGYSCRFPVESSWIAAAAFLVAQSLLVWAEIRLRPPQRFQRLPLAP